MATPGALSRPMSKPKRWRGKSPAAEKPYAWQSIAAMARALEVCNCAQGLATYVALSVCEARAPAAHKGKFFASEDEIARRAGLSRRRITPYLEKLEAARLVLRYRPVGKAKLDHQTSRWAITSFGRDETSHSEQDETSHSEVTETPTKTSHIEEYPLPKGREDIKGKKAARRSADAKGAVASPDGGSAPASAAEQKDRSPLPASKVTTGEDSWNQFMQ